MDHNLGSLEELILLLVIVMEDEAYGVSLAEEYRKINKKSISVPAVHTVLKRLEKKGFLKSSFGGNSKIRGGRRKKIYMVTNAGYQTAKAIQDNRSALWAMAPKLSFNG